jgi:ectoine hydroxylase-related dioxygenase (phytanoyl-CoA dioxygenase family)
MLAGSDRNYYASVTGTADLIHCVEQDGFPIVSSCLHEELTQSLAAQLREGSYAKRNLLALPIVRELATSPALRNLAETVLGKHCFAVKGTFFNKTRESNWKVPWHQDLTIMVVNGGKLLGSVRGRSKKGIVHVQPTAEILSRILAIRLPGSHKDGRLSSEQVPAYEKESNEICLVPRGGALLMRPLLLHASSACAVPKPRRVIHLEFSADELPQGLHWFDRV